MENIYAYKLFVAPILKKKKNQFFWPNIHLTAQILFAPFFLLHLLTWELEGILQRHLFYLDALK